MHILIHDYAGHPFQVELSRALAERGYRVTHAYFAGDKGPKGDFTSQPDKKKRLVFAPVNIKGGYDKAAFVARRFGDIEYGRNVGALIEAEQPDIVISGNTPTEAQKSILAATHKINGAFVHWVQDFYSIAVSRLLAKKLGVIGELVGLYYRRLEELQFRRSDAVVIITDDFRSQAVAWARDPNKVFTIENWGPIAEINPCSKRNRWAEEHALTDKFVFMYTGTLGLKHDPDLLLSLARAWRSVENVRVVVAAHGVGFDRLSVVRSNEQLDNLILLPLQPIEKMSEMLSTADVLLATIEEDAGSFAVPSKVLTYLCAERAVLLAAPFRNLAARVITDTQAGLVTEPKDYLAFTEAARRLYDDAALRAELSRNGRRYAKENFAPDAIADKFMPVFLAAHSASRARNGSAVGATKSPLCR